MGTEVLRPQDLFAETLRVPQQASFQRRRRLQANGNLTLVINRKPDNSGHTKKTSPRSDKRKSPVAKKSKNAAESRRKDDVPNGGLVNGQVTLLKRGEPLDSIASKFKGENPNPKSISIRLNPIEDLAVCDTGRVGPGPPVMAPKQIRVSPPIMYAGSAVSSSPSPRAVPLPSFFNKKQQHGDLLLDDSATRDLRRLLRLD